METIQTTSTETTETIQTPETSNQTQNSEEVKKESKWLRKYVLIGATTIAAIAAVLGYIEHSKNKIPSDMNIPTEEQPIIIDQASSALVANLKDTDSQPNPEKTSTEWVSDWDDENFDCLREKPQWDSRLRFLESQYTNDDHEGIMRFNNDGDDDNIPSVEDAGEILKGTKRDTINLVITSNLLTKENIEALKENSNIKNIKTNSGIISKEQFLKELELFKNAYAQI